jgi:two-component system, cell cycle sensor histidine kinase and response regulator CckA
MNTRGIQTLFGAPPRFDDRSDDLKALLVSLIARAVIIGLVASFFPHIATGNLFPAMTICTALVLVFGSLHLLRRRRLAAASSLFLYTVLISMFGLAALTDGIRDAAVFAIPGIMIVAGFVLEKKHAYFFSAAGILSIAALGAGEYAGVIHTPYPLSNSIHTTFDVIVITVVTVIGVLSLAEQVRENVRQGQDQATRLEIAEHRYRSMVENVNQAYYEADRLGRFIYVNAGFAAMGGYVPEDLLGKSSFRLVADEDQPRVIAAYKKWMQDRRPDMAIEFRVRTGEGAIFWVEQVTHFEFDPSGAFLRATNIIKNIDDRKRAEEHLRQSQITYRGILNAMAEALYIQDENGNFIDVNEGAERMYGYSRDELIGKSPAMVSADGMNDVETVMKQVQQAFNGTPQMFEFWGKRRSGQVFPKEVHLYPGLYFGKKAIIAIAQDITARKQAEEALHSSEALFRAVVENSHEGLLLIGEDGIIRYASPSLTAMLGLSNAELVGMNSYELTHPADGEFMTKLAGQIMGQSDLRLTIEHRFRQADGGWLWFESRATNMLSNPHVQSIVVNCRNITDARSASEQLKEAEERYRGLFLQATDGIIINDFTGRMIDVNHSFARMHGYVREELLGKNIKSLDAPGSLKDFQERRKRLQDGETVQFNVDHLHKNGHRIPLEVVANKIRIKDVDYVMVFHRDVTERMRSEEQRVHLEYQLAQAQKMQSMGTLAAGIAHDFNNILNIILANATLVDEEPDSAETNRKRAAAIMKASDRGAKLVKQVLTFARKSDVELSVVDVNAVIRELARLLEETFPKTITVELELDGRLPAISADPNQVHQVILNMSVNARDAMPAGGTLKFATRRVEGSTLAQEFPEASSPAYVEITVSDTGTGIDEETRKRIFEPFFTTKEIGKGSGLGLAVAYGILQKHNGFIDVKSKQGRGTSFHLYIPAMDAQGAAAESATAADTATMRGNETILYVEDENLLREMTSLFLANRGYTVIAANDGNEGLARFIEKAGEIAAVVSDLGLPGISGEQLFREVRSRSANIPFILTTGFIEPEKKTEMLDAGMASIVHKPYQMTEILAHIREAIDAID